MHPLRWVLVATVALALASNVGGRPLSASDDDLPLLNEPVMDTPINDHASVLLALDSEPTSPSEPSASESNISADLAPHATIFTIPTLKAASNTTGTLVETFLMALNADPSGPVQCNKGKKDIKVIFFFTSCFTDDELKVIFAEINAVIAATIDIKFYLDDEAISRKYIWGGYNEGCRGSVNPGDTGVVQYNTVRQDFDLFVNVAKGEGRSAVQYFPLDPSFLILSTGSTLDIRVCAGASCLASTAVTDVTVASVTDFKQVATAVINAMYCPSLRGASPMTYTGDQDKKQCGCKCPGDKVPQNGKCGCPGELIANDNNQCGCTDGRIKTADNKCTCSGGRTYSTIKRACVCSEGSTFTDNVCVRDCFWRANNDGFSCQWQEQDKQSLKLATDCHILAPVAKDNYVADKRSNKFDSGGPGTYSSPSDSPKITITATKDSATQTKATSWLNYVLQPGNLEDDVKLDSFGVYDLSMVATDYRSAATCPGCVAVVDDYPPTPKTSCQTSDTRTTTEPFSTQTLASHVSAEAKFTSFYGSDNVLNNNGATNDNKRCDEEVRKIKDFFKTEVTETTDVKSTSQSCFTSNYVKDLLDSASSTSLPALSSLVGTTAGIESLVCERCCFKSIVLKEHYAKYQCGVQSPTWDKQGTSNCKFGRCLKMQPADLLTGSSRTTDASNTKTKTTLDGLAPGTNPDLNPNVIHRSITCTSFSQDCKVQPKLGDLVQKDISWNAAEAAATTFKAADFVYWRYKAGATTNWQPWNDADVLTFTMATTAVTIQAWSRCGLVYESTYYVKLHTHSPREVCNNFRQRWIDNAPSPNLVDGNICAYPGSDFALLTFQYDSTDNVNHALDTVKGKYTDVQCELTVAPENAATTTASTRLSLSWSAATDGRITIAKQFALELLKDPTTAKNTDVAVTCSFKFKYYDSDKEDNDPCAATFRLTDCSRPSMQTFSADAVCLPDKCGSPNGPPGAFETCAGDVYTTVKAGTATTTAKKTMTDACCTDCASTLTCNALPESTNGIKRCEPPLPGGLLMLAQATDESDIKRFARPSIEKRSTVMAMLMGASAMVAVVALVVVAKKTRAKTAAQSVDDAYVSLLD